MIVVDQEGLNPKNYRKYNIRYELNINKKTKTDDYYMIKEVLSRRLRNINKNSNSILPNVIIVDGGRGQFNIAKKILKEKFLDSIALIGISKGKKRNSRREIIHTTNRDIALKPNDSLLYFLQRIRDEAHRFAITSHRSRRGKQSIQSVFEKISGVGPKRKKSLINHFGSLEKIKNADLEELKAVNSLSEQIAIQIYDFFHR